MEKKNNNTALIIAIVVIVVLAAVIVYSYYSRENVRLGPSTTQPVASGTCVCNCVSHGVLWGYNSYLVRFPLPANHICSDYNGGACDGGGYGGDNAGGWLEHCGDDVIPPQK